MKTEFQRDEILAAAIDIFFKDGYERATIEKVATALGMDKAAIQGYFSSKEDLFSEAILKAIRADATSAFAAIVDGAHERIEDALVVFGKSYLNFQLQPCMLEITRLALSEGRSNSLGIRLHAGGTLQGWRLVAELVAKHATGEISSETARKIAMQFKVLLSADLIDQRLRGLLKDVSSQQVHDASKEATRVVMAAWPDVFSKEKTARQFAPSPSEAKSPSSTTNG